MKKYSVLLVSVLALAALSACDKKPVAAPAPAAAPAADAAPAAAPAADAAKPAEPAKK